MRIDVISLFPPMFEAVSAHGAAAAQAAKGVPWRALVKSLMARRVRRFIARRSILHRRFLGDTRDANAASSRRHRSCLHRRPVARGRVARDDQTRYA